MNAQSTIRVGLGMVFWFELILGKGFGIVLLCVCRNRDGIQTDKGRVHNAQLVKLLYLLRHDVFQFSIVQLLQKTLIRPVGRQWFHDVESAVVRNETVVFQVIRQVRNLRKTFAFHDNKCTDHCFFREASPPGCRSGQREVQFCKQFVVEHSGALGCEQCYILNDFLSVDSGQPLSG